MIISSKDAVRNVRASLFCADPHFDQNKSSIYLVSWSIKFLFTHGILYVFFESTIFGQNSAAITCLYVTDSDASIVFHMQSRIMSEEFKW